ncbi:DUF4383 domain-containing protein [Micromonospora sp. WMMD1082]|uniref:DUF4383 domain-containing protein n=1 Tax=Micromonospora sp. WMMD1082 TaxID=3016104 RepID=UPI002417DE9B|nr:DUF4383 domain-containing protein [Micromonospora sp. WMMD1082]MDG4796117.1 DUF4383 domain-containing protein [Micromonospora sp. WMMD1082]
MARQARGRTGRARVQLAAMIIAGILLLLGLLGFVPGITTGYGEMTFAGHRSGAELFGLFQVSILRNLVFVVSGLIGLALARRLTGARVFLAVGGALYLLLWIYGLATEDKSGANWLPVNGPSDWLHLALGFGMLALGLLLSNAAGTDGRLDDPIDRP